MENETKFKSCFERGYSVYKVDYIFPTKDNKLLTKLLKTRAVYDETRCQILTNSLTTVNKAKTKNNKNPCDFQKLKAIIDLVTTVDKGADLSKMTKEQNCYAKAKSTFSRNKATQMKQLKNCCDQDKKHTEVHNACSDPCKMGMVQNRCQTTIQVQMVENCPKQNLQTLLCQMCKPIKMKPCKPENGCCKKTKNACTKTSSSKTKTIKSEVNMNVSKCCSPNKDCTKNSLIVNFLRKRGSRKCCKMSKPDLTQITNIFCCNKTKPCSTHVVEHRTERKRCSQTKFLLKKKGTQSLSKPCCAVQWKPNKTKSSRSVCSKSSSKKKGKRSKKVAKKPSARKSVKKKPSKSQCKCDKNVQTKYCKKSGKCSKNKPCQDSNCSCCRTCMSNRIYHSIVKVKKGCCQQIVRSYSVICNTTRTCCNTQKPPVSKSRKVNTVRSAVKMKKVQSIEIKPQKEKCSLPPHQEKKIVPVRRGLKISSNCCVDVEFYRDRPRKVKPENGKNPHVDKVKKVNKGTKTKPACCSLCYFVEIYRKKPDSIITVSSSTSSLKSSTLSSSGCDSTCSSSIENVKYRTITFDDYSPSCERLLTVDTRKLSDHKFQNMCAHGTLTKDMLKKGLFTKFCSATTFDEECQLKVFKDNCVDNKNNVFFRELGYKLFRDLTSILYLSDAFYAAEQIVKDFLFKNDILKCGVYRFSRYCNQVLSIFLKEMDSFRTSLKTYYKILF